MPARKEFFLGICSLTMLAFCFNIAQERRQKERNYISQQCRVDRNKSILYIYLVWLNSKFLLIEVLKVDKKRIFYSQADRKRLPPPHSGQGGHIMKNKKIRIKPLKTQAASPKLRPCCKDTRGIKRNSVKLTINQFQVNFIWSFACSAICCGF